MAVTLRERSDSRRVRYGAGGGGETLRFNAKGSTNQLDIMAAVALIESGQPGGDVWDGFFRSDIDVEPRGSDQWLVTIEYTNRGGFGGSGVPTGTTPASPSAPATGSTALGAGYSFDLTAETEHITQSKRTISEGALPGFGLPDTKQAIGLVQGPDGARRIEGVDVFVPKMDWSRTVARATVTRDYIRTLRGLVGKKNNATFYGSAAGEVLYLGASGQHNGQGWSITHKFSEKENITNLILAPDPADPTNPAAANALVVTSAKGWDYTWVGYKNEVADNEVAPRPVFFKVEEVYPDGNFANIGIGS